MAARKTQPFEWTASTGLLMQSMLREYMRWLFPQLGAAYIPPQGVRDFTLGEQNPNDGKQPQPFRPARAAGLVLRPDLHAFTDHVFEALGTEAVQNPYPLSLPIVLVFVSDLKALHEHILFLIGKKRQAASNA